MKKQKEMPAKSSKNAKSISNTEPDMIWTEKDAARDAAMSEIIEKLTSSKTINAKQRADLLNYILSVSESLALAIDALYKHSKGDKKQSVEEAKDAAWLAHETMMEITG